MSGISVEIVHVDGAVDKHEVVGGADTQTHGQHGGRTRRHTARHTARAHTHTHRGGARAHRDGTQRAPRWQGEGWVHGLGAHRTHAAGRDTQGRHREGAADWRAVRCMPTGEREHAAAARRKGAALGAGDGGRLDDGSAHKRQCKDCARCGSFGGGRRGDEGAFEGRRGERLGERCGRQLGGA